MKTCPKCHKNLPSNGTVAHVCIVDRSLVRNYKPIVSYKCPKCFKDFATDYGATQCCPPVPTIVIRCGICRRSHTNLQFAEDCCKPKLVTPTKSKAVSKKPKTNLLSDIDEL